MSGDKERFLFEELMRGIEEMALERKVHYGITQDIEEAIEASKKEHYEEGEKGQ